VRSLALQSTGGDWAPCLRFSNSRGWRWYLVSAQHTTNVPGRKSDVEECHRPFCCLFGVFFHSPIASRESGLGPLPTHK
jgi:hypothetical protein